MANGINEAYLPVILPFCVADVAATAEIASNESR